MTKARWKSKIKKACVEVGTYRAVFDPVIMTLAGILEKRDQAEELFEQDGNIIVNHTNKAGSTNREQNPALRLINDLNRDALVYWRELGLTPAGLKKLNESALKVEGKGSSLEEVLKKLGS